LQLLAPSWAPLRLLAPDSRLRDGLAATRWARSEVSLGAARLNPLSRAAESLGETGASGRVWRPLTALELGRKLLGGTLTLLDNLDFVISFGHATMRSTSLRVESSGSQEARKPCAPSHPAHGVLSSYGERDAVVASSCRWSSRRHRDARGPMTAGPAASASAPTIPCPFRRPFSHPVFSPRPSRVLDRPDGAESTKSTRAAESGRGGREDNSKAGGQRTELFFDTSGVVWRGTRPAREVGLQHAAAAIVQSLRPDAPPEPARRRRRPRSDPALTF